MSDTKIVNAKISKTMLGHMDYGYMSFVLSLEFDGVHQGFGTYDLRFYTIDLIEKILNVVGVQTWEELEGKVIRIEKGPWGSSITRIGNVLKDEWLDMDEIAEKIEKEKEV